MGLSSGAKHQLDVVSKSMLEEGGPTRSLIGNVACVGLAVDGNLAEVSVCGHLRGEGDKQYMAFAQSELWTFLHDRAKSEFDIYNATSFLR